MDTCPNEILGLIFADACTDDGLTGRSLSLVSRRIHDTSRRHALQSVALYGRSQISAFASLLYKAKPEDRGVRHLFLTDRRRVLVEYLPEQDEEQWLKKHLAAESSKVDRTTDPSYRYSSSSILSVLTVVSPTLQTLTILLFDRYDQQPLSNTLSFPKLCDLTLHGSRLTHTVYSELPQCISLRRLHVLHDSAVRRPMTEAVSHLAPLLTHLRISRLVSNPRSYGDILSGIEQMLLKDDLVSTGFPPTLEHVLVQLLQERFCSMIPSTLAHRLKDIAMRDVQRRVVLLKPAVWYIADTLNGENSDVRFYTGIKAAWAERSVGSESAVWDVESSSILASYGYCAVEE